MKGAGFLTALLTCGSVLLICCSPSAEEVVKKRFPECFNRQVGATTWATCEQAEGVWHITFWHGWGDCPAGCIHSEQSAWYVVNEKGEVYKADRHFNPTVKIGPDQPIDRGTPSFKKKPQAATTKEPAGLKTDKDVNKGGNKEEDKTVWLGRSFVVPQCMRKQELRQVTSMPLFGATVLETRFTPPAKPGEEFKKKTSEWEKQRFERNREEFLCEACGVCSNFARKYIKVYEKDADKFTKGPGGWMRINK